MISLSGGITVPADLNFFDAKNLPKTCTNTLLKHTQNRLIRAADTRGYGNNTQDKKLERMGSSAKKKKDKKKDFQKPMLKVGKARPKAANATETGFKVKAIVLTQQSLTTNAPNLSTQFNHHVSLLSSRTDIQRKESLSYLASAISDLRGQPMPIPTDTLIDKCLPLILDPNPGVRASLDKLFQVLPSTDVRDHVAKMLPYIRAAMTHLSADVRRSGLNILSWLMSTAGNNLVSCPGGWTKTMECFATLLNWKNLAPNDTWSLSKTSFRTDSKTIARAMQVLEQLLDAGLLGDQMDTEGQHDATQDSPLWHVGHHQIPMKSNAYGYLNLFDPPRDDDSQMLEDRDERVELFNDRFRIGFTKGVDGAKREGGDIGRIAGQLAKIIEATSQEVS